MNKTQSDKPVVAAGLAWNPETRDWDTPVRVELRSRTEAVRWMNFQRDWMKHLHIVEED